jgi:CRISPR/Cas system CSM-associated protein Csm4 (group 5 of RAMP superfamily)
VHKEDVGEYVLAVFSESDADVTAMIEKAVGLIENAIITK